MPTAAHLRLPLFIDGHPGSSLLARACHPIQKSQRVCDGQRHAPQAMHLVPLRTGLPSSALELIFEVADSHADLAMGPGRNAHLVDHQFDGSVSSQPCRILSVANDKQRRPIFFRQPDSSRLIRAHRLGDLKLRLGGSGHGSGQDDCQTLTGARRHPSPPNRCPLTTALSQARDAGAPPPRKLANGPTTVCSPGFGRRPVARVICRPDTFPDASCVE